MHLSPAISIITLTILIFLDTFWTLPGFTKNIALVAENVENSTEEPSGGLNEPIQAEGQGPGIIEGGPNPNPAEVPEAEAPESFGGLLGQLNNLNMKTAVYGGECDLDLNEEYTMPVYYGDIDPTATWEAKLKLNDYIGQHPELAIKLCYGVVVNPPKFNFENYMVCVSCDDRLSRGGKSFYCCKCAMEEPYVFEKQPFGPCKVKESVVGDICDSDLYDTMAELVHGPFFEKIQNASTRKDYVMTLLDYAADYNSYYEMNPPGLQRFTCRSESNNLIVDIGILVSATNGYGSFWFFTDDITFYPPVWKNRMCLDGLCSCLNYTPYFEYQLEPKGKYCAAAQSSVCNINIRVKDIIFDKLSKCADGEMCKEAIPGLYCDNYDDPDCKFTMDQGPGPVPVDADGNDIGNVGEGSVAVAPPPPPSPPILFWRISSCGKPWKDKNPFLKSQSNIINGFFQYTVVTFYSFFFLTMFFLVSLFYISTIIPL